MQFSTALVASLLSSTVLARGIPRLANRYDDGMWHPSSTVSSGASASSTGSSSVSSTASTGSSSSAPGAPFATSSTSSSGLQTTSLPTGFPTGRPKGQDSTSSNGQSSSGSSSQFAGQTIGGPASLPTDQASILASSASGQSAGATGASSALGPTESGETPALKQSFDELEDDQKKNAKAIMAEVKKQGLGKQACIVTLATAYQESKFLIYANKAEVPESMNYKHDIVGGDQDSIGLFQQKAHIYCPGIASCMDTAKSTDMFLNGIGAPYSETPYLTGVPGWENMEPNKAAQTVQRAEAGDLYAQDIPMAKSACENGDFSS